MDQDSQLRANVELLEQALAGDRAGEQAAAGGAEERLRHEQAIEGALRYVALLRETLPSGCAGRYSFKRERADGRWDLAEAELASEPLLGDIVDFADESGAWQVVRRLHVRTRARQRPEHEFFACAPLPDTAPA